MLQEGKTFNGIGFQRGWHPMHILSEIMESGVGVRKLWTNTEGFLIKTSAYTTARVWGYCYFMDKVNPDTRRNARWDKFVPAALVGGVVAGIATNPFELVFARMQVDQMHHPANRWNYRNYFDGLMKVSQEGALFRGALANGLKLGALGCSMSHIFDLAKENSYFFFGPCWINRFWACLAATVIGATVSLPFDMIRLRLHVMKALPDGRMPYTGIVDTLGKILQYESDYHKGANPSSLLAGGTMYWARLFLICYVSMFLLDIYHNNKYVEEFWVPNRFNSLGGINWNPYDPFSLRPYKQQIDMNAGQEFDDGGRFTEPNKPYRMA